VNETVVGLPNNLMLFSEKGKQDLRKQEVDNNPIIDLVMYKSGLEGRRNGEII